MNIVNTGKYNMIPPSIYKGFGSSHVIHSAQWFNKVLKKVKSNTRGIDVFKYFGIKSNFNNNDRFPITTFRAFNKPNFMELRAYADTLMSKLPMTYCRIDLYNSGKGIIVGELTPIPGGAFRFYPEFDQLLGTYYKKSEINQTNGLNGSSEQYHKNEIKLFKRIVEMK
ncbi:MAG: hypothetical protein JJU28_19665 [Cyclobacteriaceae bacterium]|nr:hypothetical protein [Cyclobacteriaceae bacterium]